MKNSNALIKLESMKDFYSKSEFAIYNYIIKNIDIIPSITLKELSDSCEISEATIIRFTRKLGFKGFSDFKINLSLNIGKISEEKDLIEELGLNDTPTDVFKKISLYTSTSLQTTQDSLDDEAIMRTVELIYNAHKNNHRIFLSGVGASSGSVKQLRIKLMRLGIDVVYFEDNHLQFEAISSIEKTDVFIGFTTLGKSVEVLDALDVARKKNAKTVLITQYGDQSLKKKIDIGIYFYSVESNLRLASQIALIIQSIIIDTIFVMLALKDYEKVKESVRDSKELFSSYGYYKQ